MTITFRESPVFDKEADRLLGDDRLHMLQLHLSANPESGVPLRGGRGLRKIRWAGAGRGKRGGNRVIYYHIASESVIELVFVYSKNETEDLTRRQIHALAEALGI